MQESIRGSFMCPDSVGKILRVDLSKYTWIAADVDPEIIKKFLGGIGLSAKMLFEETGPQTDPLGPENIVIVSAGLLAGTDAPTAYRVEITTKSPLTGIAGTGSAGGLFGSRLRRAGYESVVLMGKSENPVYLVIDEGRVELKNAEHLWGKDTFATTSAIKNELGEDFSVMAIGQAGENLVRFACPIVDCYHAPGRCHAGSVMGSKNLKAIAVRGSRKIPVAFPDKFNNTVKEIDERIRDYPERGLRQVVGSICKVVGAAKRGHLPAKNYQTGGAAPGSDLWRPEDYKRHIIRGPLYCGKCSLSPYYGCHATADIKEGKYKDLYLPGVGFSFLMWNWAGKYAVESFPAMAKCKEMCNRYGMDQEGSIAFALELFQRGILTVDDFEGQALNWGDEDAILNLIDKIAHRQGIGTVLAEGSVRAAKIIGKGAEKYALTIKGMEIMDCPDPRAGGRVRNLGSMISIRGGDDVKTTHTVFEKMPDWAAQQGMGEEEYKEWFLKRLDMPEEIKEKIYGVPPSLDSSGYSPERIVLMARWYEDLSFVRDSLGICLFAVQTTSAIGSGYSAELLSSYLGWSISPVELMEAGERILNLFKAYSIREGLTRADDVFPDRFYLEPLEDGSGKGKAIARDSLNHLLDVYHEARGWDKITGYPRRDKLEGLGLRFVADELYHRPLG
jgi:aldehyde:ferredoxin oxidoreductase